MQKKGNTVQISYFIKFAQKSNLVPRAISGGGANQQYVFGLSRFIGLHEFPLNTRSSGSNRTCCPAIPVLRSNQLSYRVQLLSSARSCIYTNSGVRVVIATYHRSDLCQVAMPTTSILI